MARMLQQQMPSVKYSLTRLGGGTTGAGIAFAGGLDLVTPSLALQPGALRDCLNFECSQSGGYSRVEGYERVDGRPLPSAALYQIVQVTSFTNVPSVGQTLTQATSGATGVIIAVVQTPTPHVVVTKVTGTLDYTHNISVGATPIGTATSPTVSASPLLMAQYLNAAADVYRADITAVPGSGSVLGVVGMTIAGVDSLYAFRANAGGTAVDIYKASSIGWVLVALFKTVSFTAGGTAVPADGETLTQGGVTATIKRVAWASGAWAGTAAGKFVITTPSGGNFAAGAATTTSGATVTLSGVQTSIVLAPGGRFEFTKYNFAGQAATRRVYGCDGVNKCFEFDGTTLAPITTGLTVDAPSHILAHKGYLVISYGSSILGSAPGQPFKWSAVDGAWEIATGDVVNGLLTMPGSQATATLAVFLRGDTAVLYGNDPTTFNYVEFNSGVGALPYSAQNLFDSFVFDDFGVISLRTSQNYGNFLPASLSKNILPFVRQKRSRLIASSLSRSKGQYRAWFSDGFGLWVTMVNQQYLGSTLVLFPNPVTCAEDTDNASGGMDNYFGSTNGFVYKLESGTSFDGAEIDAFITCAWDALKSPRVLKRFRAASVEMQGQSYAEIQFGYQLGYGSPLIGQPTPVPYPTGFSSPPQWDSFVWDNFVWDGQTLFPTDVDMVGTAENVQVTIRSGTDYIAAFNVNSLIYHWSSRRGIRV